MSFVNEMAIFFLKYFIKIRNLFEIYTIFYLLSLAIHIKNFQYKIHYKDPFLLMNCVTRRGEVFTDRFPRFVLIPHIDFFRRFDQFVNHDRYFFLIELQFMVDCELICLCKNILLFLFAGKMREFLCLDDQRLYRFRQFQRTVQMSY